MSENKLKAIFEDFKLIAKNESMNENHEILKMSFEEFKVMYHNFIALQLFTKKKDLPNHLSNQQFFILFPNLKDEFETFKEKKEKLILNKIEKINCFDEIESEIF